ncbi:hypothetical protein PEC301889_07960 [Pectobacterium carotovorum subsp. carotovorum]|nr:hypothetical protein PEC301889_07960 [Pectobacterium carotovorum subsp. carotovorum]
MLLRDTAKQVQDITTLSRDVEHANNALSPIFNKEKEQKRLKQAQLIGEIGAQVMDIVRTEGELKAQKAAEAKGDAKVKRPQDGERPDGEERLPVSALSTLASGLDSCLASNSLRKSD